MNKLSNEEIIYLIIIFLILLFFWSANDFFNFNEVKYGGDIAFYLPMEYFLRQSTQENFFPHWIPYYYGGTPFFANAQNMFFRLFTLISILTPSLESNIKIQIMLIMLIGAISMYFLMLELKIKPRFAIISSLVYLFNAFPLKRLFNQLGDEFVDMYMWVPLIFLLTIKSIKAKEMKKTIVYSVLATITMAIQFHSGYLALFIYTGFLLIFFLIFYVLVSKLSRGIIKKVLVFGIIFPIIFIGLSTIKILPLLEFTKVSSLSSPLTLENAKGQYLNIKEQGILSPLKYLIIENAVMERNGFQIAIGIIPFILLLFALPKFKNRYVFFSILAIITLFMIGSGSFLFKLLWKFFPGFNRQHHIVRIFTLIPLPAAILVGIGTENLFTILSKKFKAIGKQKINHLLILGVIILIYFNMGAFTIKKDFPLENLNVNELIEQNHMMLYLPKEKNKEVFRIHNINDINIGTPAVIYATPLKLELIQGAFNVWIPEYINEYFWTYSPHAPYKFLGMLNTKYIYSSEELNTSELKLIKKFDECEVCKDFFPGHYDYGPYLYYNKEYLPRAYIVENVILVIGNYNEAKRMMYLLMINPNFNPSNTAIIMIDDPINQMTNNFLNKFKAIILTEGSINQNSIDKLREYKLKKGILLPDILENKNQINEEEINELLASSNGTYENVKKLEIINYTPNRYKVLTESKKGFMILSEKFFMFEGWKAKSNKEEKNILRANGINSAIYLNENEEYIEIDYNSKEFMKGAVISLATLIIVIIYLTCFMIFSIRLRTIKHKVNK